MKISIIVILSLLPDPVFLRLNFFFKKNAILTNILYNTKAVDAIRYVIVNIAKWFAKADILVWRFINSLLNKNDCNEDLSNKIFENKLMVLI